MNMLRQPEGIVLCVIPRLQYEFCTFVYDEGAPDHELSLVFSIIDIPLNAYHVRTRVAHLTFWITSLRLAGYPWLYASANDLAVQASIRHQHCWAATSGFPIMAFPAIATA